jgi:hypothetical protein
MGDGALAALGRLPPQSCGLERLVDPRRCAERCAGARDVAAHPDRGTSVRGGPKSRASTRALACRARSVARGCSHRAAGSFRAPSTSDARRAFADWMAYHGYFADTGLQSLDLERAIDWAGMAKDYSTIRRHISHVVPGFHAFEERAGHPGGFELPNSVRDSLVFETSTGKAHITANALTAVDVPEGRLLLQTLRSHDQFKPRCRDTTTAIAASSTDATWSSSTLGPCRAGPLRRRHRRRGLGRRGRRAPAARTASGQLSDHFGLCRNLLSRGQRPRSTGFGR